MGKAMTDNLIETRLTSNDQSRFTEMLSPYLKLADELIMQLLSITGLSGEEGPVMDYHRRPAPRGGGGGRGNQIRSGPPQDSARRQDRQSHAQAAGHPAGPAADADGPHRYGADLPRGQAGQEREVHRPGRQDHRHWAATTAAARPLSWPPRCFVLNEKPEHGPLTFLWTVQEEVGLYGARFCSLAMLGRPKLAFNFDGGPTDQSLSALPAAIAWRFASRASPAMPAPRRSGA